MPREVIVVRLIRFLLLLSVKILVMVLYRLHITWLSTEQWPAFSQVRLIIFLNHTSLFEPVFIGAVPLRALWRLSGELLAPGADITLVDRPIVGRLYRSLFPGLIPITRKKDQSWKAFLDHVTEDSLVAILPEGRMMRRSGLDKHGNPMTVRGGVADVLQKKQTGKVMFVYSGGLHHVHAPGDHFPAFWQTIKAQAEIVDISTYKAQLPSHPDRDFRDEVMSDLQRRLKQKLPHSPPPSLDGL